MQTASVDGLVLLSIEEQSESKLIASHSEQEDSWLIMQLEQELLEVFAHPFTLDEQEFFVGVSIGVSVYPEDGSDAEGILKASDSALNLAKSERRGQYCFFTPQLNRRAHRSLALETRLHKAL